MKPKAAWTITIMAVLLTGLIATPAMAVPDLSLNWSGGAQSVPLGHIVDATLDVGNLEAAQAINGVQARLHYDSTKLTLLSVTPNTSVGTGWGEVQESDIGGNVMYSVTMISDAISADHTVATLTFIAIAEGTTSTTFQTDNPPFITKLTRASDSTTIMPNTIDSGSITTGPPPEIEIVPIPLSAGAPSMEIGYGLNESGDLVGRAFPGGGLLRKSDGTTHIFSPVLHLTAINESLDMVGTTSRYTWVAGYDTGYLYLAGENPGDPWTQRLLPKISGQPGMYPRAINDQFAVGDTCCNDPGAYWGDGFVYDLAQQQMSSFANLLTPHVSYVPDVVKTSDLSKQNLVALWSRPNEYPRPNHAYIFDINDSPVLPGGVPLIELTLPAGSEHYNPQTWGVTDAPPGTPAADIHKHIIVGGKASILAGGWHHDLFVWKWDNDEGNFTATMLPRVLDEHPGYSNPGSSPWFEDMNNSGYIVGGEFWSLDLAVIWYPDRNEEWKVLDLNCVLGAEQQGWELEHALAINDARQIAGYGTYNNVTTGFLLTLPENFLETLPPDFLAQCYQE